MKQPYEARAPQVGLEVEDTKSRRSQEEADEWQGKFTLLQSLSPVAFFSLGPQGRVLSVNAAGSRLLGLAAADLIGRFFIQFVIDEDSPLFVDFLHTVFAAGERSACCLRLTTGGPRPLVVRMEAEATAGGDECLAVVGGLGERKGAEQALSESEYNLAKAQSMTHVGSWSFDPDTAEVKASDELLRILRLSREEATPEAFARVVHPEDLGNVMAHLRLGVDQGKSYEIEHRLQFAEGAPKWVFTIVEPSLNSDGEVVRLYGTTQDITERKRAEVELRNKTNELQTIFDSIGDGITVYDQTGRIQHHNLISPQLFPKETKQGKSCREIFHPESRANPLGCPVERALKGERVDASLVITHAGQKTQYVDITATPIKDAMGEKNRALVFFRDVSEKRLQEMHLIQAEKMSSIGVLATGIAHEINNPLTSVAGCAEALLRRFREEPSLKKESRFKVFPHYLEVIIRECYRCKGIIDHLLSFGRRSEGTAVDVDINLILLEVLELLKYQSNYRQIKVVTKLVENLPRVFGDPSGLRQVCMNLLINAHQAIQGRGVVEVTTEVAESGMVSIGIRDTGCGMPQQILDRIWEPFFTTKEAGSGVGLGLALTYDIVKRHGGDIESESRLGEGTRFTVTLPICRG